MELPGAGLLAGAPPAGEFPDANNTALIDLAQTRQCERKRVWSKAAHDILPGLSVALAEPQPRTGLIARSQLGAGEFFTIESGPADVYYRGPDVGAGGGRPPYVSVMVQCRGEMVVRQAGRTALVRAGDLCLLDEASSFRLTGDKGGRILFARLPRAAVLSRYPLIGKLLVRALPGEEPGTAILSDTLRRVARDCPKLGEGQRAAMAGMIIHMLGIAGCFSESPDAPDWRVQRALDFIELNLSAAGLTAQKVAEDQNISRRRLDQLMHEAFGCSVAAHLWNRRLEQAAADLRDCNRMVLSIAQIAFANGFEDPAHFTRAFKRRYSLTPGQWRRN